MGRRSRHEDYAPNAERAKSVGGRRPGVGWTNRTGSTQNQDRSQGVSADAIIDIALPLLEKTMPDLLVRGVDEAIVKALKERAGRHGRSAEAEHRAILAAALLGPRKRSFAEVLAAMPDVGQDTDFERVQDSRKTPRVFD